METSQTNFPMPAIATGPLIQRRVEDGICLITFDRPESGANVFDAPTLQELAEHLDFIEKETSLRGVILNSAKKSIFVAGADLKTLLRQAQNGQLREFIAEGQRIFNRLAGLKIPTCAAIHGAAAGGGYEVALACDWRVASEDPATRIGLPETGLGLVPAWGGCTRLAPLVGRDRAAEAILKGKLYAAKEALQMGIVDELVSRDLLLDAAKGKLRDGKRKIQAAAPASQDLRPPSTSGNEAPARAYEIITRDLPPDRSLAMELDAIVDLGNSEATRNLIRNFFLAEKYKRGTSKAPADKIVHAAVIGAGVMGSGIAHWLSSRGVTVILRDVNRELVDRGLASIEKTYADAVKRGIMTEEKAKEGRARIICSTAHVEMRDVGIVIEAASEKLEVKKAIFQEVSAAAPKAILATNTSALPIQELAEQTGSPGRVVGLHFFNPVSRMKLIEVVVSKSTSSETRDRALGFARQIGKLPVLVRDSPGFLVNRVLFPYLVDAAGLYESGIGAETIDRALVKWGMPMGPLRLIDEIGVDVTVDIANTLEKAYASRDHAGSVLLWLRESKMLGRKTGSGFYRYEGKSQPPNDALERWRSAAVAGDDAPGQSKAVTAPGSTPPATLANRLIFLMVNEAARCLEEKVVESAEDADYGMILGTGFAPYRGGPLRFADHYGLVRLAGEMEQLAKNEEKFSPCEILRTHARNGTTFYED
jgi:3-hydroxyacyl-CoA dehydrogenase/enoyl-CoA hydratase/3-hydroxybutyryl-CoA epimerase